ncbi:MAG: T9SS type A sorting domain-containing protein [Ignavibacteria bacterium]|nr:T9SS type A sorting domain-containing protein [Ignavibacteria bacterium]
MNAQVTEPELPRTSDVVSCYPDTTGYVRRTVGPVGRDYSNLQLAITEAQLGTVLVLDAGATFSGSFTLPNKSGTGGWIIIESSKMDLLPSDGKRIVPTSPTSDPLFALQADAMPKIITTNLSGLPCFTTQARAHHYRLVGLEISAASNVIESYGLVNLGDGTSAQNTMGVVPHHFVIDRCYIHGHTNGRIMKFGIRLDCANAAIIDSHISDFHSVGFDAQAIAGINGPGPFKIINNYLEASGENILFGGAAAAIPGLVPSDIEIRQNHFYKPWSWKVGHPTYSGKHWPVKNLFELKTGMRVLLDGNILENCWADLPIGQSGYAILLTIRTEDGGSPQADVSDITISNNIIRHVGAGIAISGSDDGKGIRSKRIKIFNNLFEDVNGPAYGDQNTAGPNDGTFLKIGQPQDVIVDHNTIFQTGAITWAYQISPGFTFTNNVTNSLRSSGGYQGVYGPGYAQGNTTIAHFFPDITDQNQRFTKNVLIGTDSTKYSMFTPTSKNFFPKTANAIRFVDFAKGASDYHNYALQTQSPFHNIATDGNDVGVNFSRLDSAFTQRESCAPITSSYAEPQDTAPSGKYFVTIELYPNPVSDYLTVTASETVLSFVVSDLQGRIILNSNKWQGALPAAPNGRFEIDAQTFPVGVYVIALVSQRGVNRTFFVVSR